jgi:hypothetical protein
MASSRNVLEREVEKYLTDEVKKLGGQCFKFIPDYARGMPDRLVVLPKGISFWVETKRPVGGRLSAAQKLRHLELRRLGQRVEVGWSREDVDRIVREVAMDFRE